MTKGKKTESFGEMVNRQIRASGGVRSELSTPPENRAMNAFIRAEKAAGEGVLDVEDFFGSEGDREG